MERRKFIAAAGAAVSGIVAGCTGGGSSNTDTENNSSAATTKNVAASSTVFQSVGFEEGRTFVIELKDDADVDKVRVVNSKGENVKNLRFGTGVSRVSRTIRKTLNVDWEFIALKEDEEVGSVTKSFTAELDVKDIKRQFETEGLELNVSTNYDEYYDPKPGVDGHMPETKRKSDLWPKYSRAVLTVENTGNAPFTLNGKPSFLDGTPQNDKKVRPDNDNQITIQPGESKQVKTALDYDFLFVTNAGGKKSKAMNTWSEPLRDKYEFESLCTGETIDATLVYFDTSGKRYEKTIPITYSGDLVRLSANHIERYYICENISAENSS